MICIKPEKSCPYRDEYGYCHWHCEHDLPQSECELANEFWGCPYTCIYEALEGECPFKDSLEKMLEKAKYEGVGNG